MNASLELRGKLDRVGGRFRSVKLLTGLAVGWAVVAALGLALLLVPSRISPRDSVILVGALAVALGLAWWVIARRTARNPHWVAQKIEAANPDLSALLLTAVDQTPASGERLNFLQESVVESAVMHSRVHRWDETVPQGKLNSTRIVHAAAFAAMAVVIALLANRSLGTTISPENPASTSVALATGEGIRVEVQPGHVSIERGSPLLVTAKFPGSVPVEASLIFDSTPPIANRTMSRNLDDPTFAGHLASIDADLNYRVEFPGGTSETFRVTVYEHPELKKASANLAYPSFTKLPPKLVEDVRHVTVVEGTTVTLTCTLNKPAAAVLVDEAGATMPLTPVGDEAPIYIAMLKPEKSQRYRVQLTDADGRTNKLPASFAIYLTKNQPPVVTAKVPGRDSRVSPIEELNLLAEARDDFGLVRYGVNVTTPDGETKDLVLGESPAEAALKKVQPAHLIDLEALKAEPDQVVSYFFWAEDIGPDGKARRTSGDLYFAEVRHFEEIFRQGEQQSQNEQQNQQQQGQGNAQQAEELAEMQKQIIAGIWKVIRREIGAEPTTGFAGDIDTLKQSQQAVLEKAGALLEKLQAPASIEFLKQAMKHMTDTETKLGEAAIPSLPAARNAAQAAYQALLKLRAREFEVTRNNSRQRQQSARAGSQSRSPSQQQLRELDLNDEENRYETQRQAQLQQQNQAQRDREQRELQELANKLRDLARRQSGITDRVKELQAALEQATDEQKKAELQRQLKRLQEEQQQVLRDTDNLQEQMEREENRDRMAESRQQAEQSRESVRQASEALEKGQLQKAVNEGTRAGRQMEELRDKLRKEAAGRFGEEMRDLRRQARELDQNQQDLTKKLDEMNKEKGPSLREPAGKEQVQKGLDQQKQDFDKLQERVQNTVREAEETEPALAQALFNTARKAAEQKTGEAMDAARKLAEAGAAPEAADASRHAARGTEELRKGIEKAAENVLGGQTEALKRAQRELDELAKSLDREIAQATGQDPSKEPASGGRKSPEGKPGGKDGTQPGKDGQGAKGKDGEQPGGEGKGAKGNVGQQPGGEGKGAKGKDGQQPGSEGEGKDGQPGGKGGGQPSIDDLPEKPDLRKLGGMPRKGQPNESATQNGGAAGPHGPIREQGFREWFDRMRAAEELIEDPKLRADAANIREKVRSEREQFKRHSKEPNWDLLREQASKPLTELRERIAAEIRRRESPDALVPIDRDPVPPEFIESVRKYYERLGSDR